MSGLIEGVDRFEQTNKIAERLKSELDGGRTDCADALGILLVDGL